MRNAAKARRILFLAQLPPPFHGQSQVAGAVHKIFTDDAGAQVSIYGVVVHAPQPMLVRGHSQNILVLLQ